MADDTPPAKAKKIVDIAHPGDSAPSPNSKSVIITHRPTMRDPMMNDDTPVSDATEPSGTDTPTPATRASHGVIQPLESSPKPVLLEAPAAGVPAVTQATVSDDLPSSETAEKAEPATPAQFQSELTPTSTGTPKLSAEPVAPKTTTSSSDAKIGTKDIQTEADAASAEDAEAERQTNLQKLVDDKTYYLPINTLETQRTKQFVAIGSLLSIVLVVAWADIALDAGLVHIGNLKALTHFFN
jgi:hypothetical protein